MMRISSGLVQVSFSLEPVHLWAGVSPDDVSLLVLDLPGDHDDYVAFAYPDALLHLTAYAAHPGHAVHAFYGHAVRAQHTDHCAQHFVLVLIRGPYPRDDFAFRPGRPSATLSIWPVQCITFRFILLL